MDRIIFDLDGTIWDPVDTVLRIFTFVNAEYGFGQVSEYDMKVKSFEELLKVF